MNSINQIQGWPPLPARKKRPNRRTPKPSHGTGAAEYTGPGAWDRSTGEVSPAGWGKSQVISWPGWWWWFFEAGSSGMVNPLQRWSDLQMRGYKIHFESPGDGFSQMEDDSLWLFDDVFLQMGSETSTWPTARHNQCLITLQPGRRVDKLPLTQLSKD